MITDSKHNWAYGCVKCSYGVKDEHYTAPTGAVELVLERLVMAERVGPDYFCDCQAGQALRRHLLAVRERYNAMHTRFEGQDVEIGKVILSAARVAMAQPHNAEGNRIEEIENRGEGESASAYFLPPTPLSASAKPHMQFVGKREGVAA